MARKALTSAKGSALKSCRCADLHGAAIPFYMKTLRANRSPEPEILIRLALYLLELAGAELLAWHTVAEVALAVGLDKESIRLAIRRGQLEAVFDGRLLQYFVPHSALCRFCETRGVPVPGFVGAQGSVALLPEPDMINNPNKPLSPLERSQLDRLLDKLGGGRVEAMAQTAEAAAAEQQRLRGEQQRLAEQEQRLSAKLQTIRSDLDATTTELMARARQRRANRNLVEYLETIRTQLDGVLARSPDYAGRVDPKELTTLMRALFDNEVDRTDAVRSRFQELTAAPQLTEDDRARLQAEEVIATGKRWGSGAFRDDALPPTNKRGKRQ
jgi:hypothetical protein